MLPARPLWVEIVNGVVSFQHSKTEMPFSAADTLTFKYLFAKTVVICRRKANLRGVEKRFIVRKDLRNRSHPVYLVLMVVVRFKR